MTSALETDGYWPSYNVPYFVELFDYAGYPAAIQQQGPEMLSYDQCVRAQIFRQRYPAVHHMEDLQFLLQYNDYLNDPISQKNPIYAIAARGDLGSKNKCFGAIDCTVSDYHNYHKDMSVYAFCGPTPQQETFSFRTTNVTTCGPHKGVPEIFNFSFQLYSMPKF